MNPDAARCSKPFVFLCVSFLLILVNPATAADPTNGKTVYQHNCQACHQADGVGIQGAFPPLAENSNLSANPDYVARAIVQGVSGPVEVSGSHYNGVMPAMAHISNKQVVDLVAYILSDLNSAEGAVSEEVVEALR